MTEGTVVLGTGGSRTRFVKGLAYPIDEGLTLGTKKLPERVGEDHESSVSDFDEVGL